MSHRDGTSARKTRGQTTFSHPDLIKAPVPHDPAQTAAARPPANLGTERRAFGPEQRVAGGAVCRCPRRGNLRTGETGTPQGAARLVPRTQERGPSMYEMEGPRLAPAALACRLPGHRAPRGCHRPRVPARLAGLRDPSCLVPRHPARPASGSPRLGTSSVVTAFLLPTQPGTQGLCAGSAKILLSSTGHLPFIPRAP